MNKPNAVAVALTPETVAKFWRNVESTPVGECWLWIGPHLRDGRGTLWVNSLRRNMTASRFSFALHNGTLPPTKMFVCHTCDNPACVNPGHLFLGTNRDNVDDMLRKRRQRTGERHLRAKLTAADVLEIRKSPLSIRVLAAKYGVNKRTLFFAKSGRTWRFIAAPLAEEGTHEAQT